MKGEILMKKVIIKRSLFRKYTFDIPELFADKCGKNDTNDLVFFEDDEGSKITFYANSPTPNTELKFKRGEEVLYKDVTGFFLYDDEIFYKDGKKSSGKRVRDGLPMRDVISIKMCKDNVQPKVISSVYVTKLTIK